MFRGRANSPAIGRDWSEALGAVAYQPIFDFSFNAALSGGTEAGFGSLNTLDVFDASYTGDLGMASGLYLATGGTLTITESGLTPSDVGTYPLYPVGPGPAGDTCSGLQYDNLLAVPSGSGTSPIDANGLIFGSAGNINIW
ncbi:MAG: hypothetical protein ACLQMG_08520, partial [Terracidiphilus sp.]